MSIAISLITFTITITNQTQFDATPIQFEIWLLWFTSFFIFVIVEVGFCLYSF